MDEFNDFVARTAGAIQEYLAEEDKAAQAKVREFLSPFYAGSQFMDLLTESNLITLSEQVHGNMVYQTFVYDLQMSVLTAVGREVTERIIERLGYGIATRVEYQDNNRIEQFSVGPVDDSRFKVSDQDIIQRLRANRWLVPLLVLAWAEVPENPRDGAD